MANKEMSYDPQPEYDSETEREDDYISNDQEMNNNRVSSPTQPGSLTGAFVLNDIVSDCGEATENSGGWRRGGPLMNPGEKEKQDKEKQDEEKVLMKCINYKVCHNLTAVRYKAIRFQCDESYSDDPKELEAHNQLCLDCAQHEENCPNCIEHGDPYKHDADDDDPVEAVEPAN